MNDKEILKFVKSFRKGILGGREPNDMCYLVCAPLSNLLQLMGVKCELWKCEVSQEEGIFVHFAILYNGKIIDPTASQFKDINGKKYPDVYFGDVPSNYSDLT